MLNVKKLSTVSYYFKMLVIKFVDTFNVVFFPIHWENTGTFADKITNKPPHHKANQLLVSGPLCTIVKSMSSKLGPVADMSSVISSNVLQR